MAEFTVEVGTLASNRSSKNAAAGRRPVLNLVAGIAAIALIGAVGFYVFRGSDKDTAEGTQLSSSLGSVAGHAADENVRVLSGSAHTVYHATSPLPSASQPQVDGLPTLVWFSGTWCTFCRQMESFAFETAAEFDGQVRFVEKSVDHDSDATAKYGVRGTPTFVLIDAQGKEIGRFGFQSTAAEFEMAIAETLKKLPA